MRHQNGSLFDETIPAGTDNFVLETTAGTDIALGATCRALYFPAAVAAVVVTNGAGASVGPFAVPAGALLPIATNTIKGGTTSASKILVLF